MKSKIEKKMGLAISRQKYRKGEITFNELSLIFFENGTDEDRQEFWKSHVFDRPCVIEGLNQKERDNRFSSMFN
jgi:hypothetical protein